MVSPQMTSRHGFTLVELSIVIIIIGLLTAGGLAAGTKMVERAAYIDTRKTLDQLQETLKHYYIVHGRLPCPASISAAPTSSSFGVEQSCGSTGVRVGGVPTRALGLPDSMAADKFGSRIVYAVSQSLTNANNFGSGSDAITVQDIGGTISSPNAAYVLASMGRDRKGAYIHNTGQRPRSCGSTANLDTLNCTLTTSEFRDAPFNNGEVANRFFDDVVGWAPKFHFTAFNTQSNTLWALRGGSNDIHAVGSGDINTTRVGIGTTTPLTKLHVVGSNNVLRLQGTSNVYMDFYAKGSATRSGYLGYYSTASNDMTVRNDILNGNINIMPYNGNVGVGTAAPAERLHTSGNIRTDGRRVYFGADQNFYGLGSTMYLNSSSETGNYLYLRNSLNSTLLGLYGTANGGVLTVGGATRLSFNNETGSSSYVYAGASSDKRLVLMGGNTFTNAAFTYLHGRNHAEFPGAIAQVATTASTASTTRTHIWGRYDSGTTFESIMNLYADGHLWIKKSPVTYSDIRLKTDIQTVDDALDKLEKLKGVSFLWKEDEDKEDATRSLGVIAQDVQAVFPELVSENEKGYLSVNMDGLIAPLIEAVKQLKTENELQALRIAELEGHAKPENSQVDMTFRPLDKFLLTGFGILLVGFAALFLRATRRG